MEEDAKKEDETLLPFRLATLFGNFVGYFKNLDNSQVFPGRYNKAWIPPKKSIEMQVVLFLFRTQAITVMSSRFESPSQTHL